MQAFKLSKPPKAKAVPPSSLVKQNGKDEVAAKTLGSQFSPSGFAAVCASASAVSAAKAAAAAVAQGSAGLGPNAGAGATSFLGRAAVQSSAVATADAEVANKRPRQGGLSAAALAAAFGGGDEENLEDSKLVKSFAEGQAGANGGKAKADIEVEEDSSGPTNFLWDAKAGALVDAKKKTMDPKEQRAPGPGIHDFVGGAEESEDDEISSSASSSGDEASNIGPCPVLLPDGNVELSDRVIETNISVNPAADVGAGLELRWKKGFGFLVKHVDADPGQERLAAGDIIESIGGEALCLESEDATAAVFKKHLKHGAMIRVQLGDETTRKAIKAVGGGATAVESKARDAASTPELMAQAAAAGMAKLSDRWVFDQASQLNFYRASKNGITYCWNEDQGYMHKWIARGKMEFLWAGRNPLPGAPKPPPPKDVDGKDEEIAKAKGIKASSEPHDRLQPEARGLPVNADASGERALWITVIPPSLLFTSAEKTEAIIELPKRALKGWGGKKGLERMEEIGKQSGGATITKEQRQKLEMPKKKKEKDKKTEECEDGGDEYEAKLGQDQQLATQSNEVTTTIVTELRIKGTRQQVQMARSLIDMTLVETLGQNEVEKMSKHRDRMELEKKRQESGESAASGGIPELGQFAMKWGISAVMVRKLRKLDTMSQRYIICHFDAKKAKPQNAIKKYMVMLLMHPQRWRLEALEESGELGGEIAETVVVGSGGAAVGRQSNTEIVSEGEEQFVELEVDEGMEEKKASKTFGDIATRHCRFMRMGEDFYAWAQESQVGTIVDGRKYRQMDGPVPLRDGSLVSIGKYLVHCEVGDPVFLNKRRKQLSEGARSSEKEVRTSEQLMEEAEKVADENDQEEEDEDDDGDENEVTLDKSGQLEEELVDQEIGDMEDMESVATKDQESSAELRKRKREDEPEDGMDES